jgi:predicted transglutaminase-like cysteine proteinase
MQRIFRLVLAAVVLASQTTQTSATLLGSAFKHADRLLEAAPALAPLSHVKFCLDYPAECQRRHVMFRPFRMTPERLAIANEINSRVNSQIVPTRKDGLMDWTVSPVAGDCNDFAVTKRHELIARKWPSGVLSLAVVQTRSGEGHLVLIIRSRDSDLVLDNLQQHVRRWTDLNYRWLKVQSGSNPRHWFTVGA